VPPLLARPLEQHPDAYQEITPLSDDDAAKRLASNQNFDPSSLTDTDPAQAVRVYREQNPAQTFGEWMWSVPDKIGRVIGATAAGLPSFISSVAKGGYGLTKAGVALGEQDTPENQERKK